MEYQKLKTFSDFVNESQMVNESLLKPTPQKEKELEKALAPLIKKFKINVKYIYLNDWSKLPNLAIETYNLVKSGNWVSGQFFNEVDAKRAAELFSETEITAAPQIGKGGVEIKYESFPTYLYWEDIQRLNTKFGLKIDIDKIEKIAEEMKGEM